MKDLLTEVFELMLNGTIKKNTSHGKGNTNHGFNSDQKDEELKNRKRNHRCRVKKSKGCINLKTIRLSMVLYQDWVTNTCI